MRVSIDVGTLIHIKVVMMRSYIDIGRLSGDAVPPSKSNMNNILTDHEPVYMYHISSEELHDRDNERVVLHPIHCYTGESGLSHIKRTCVAPSVEQCLCAVAHPRVKEFNIYRTVMRVPRSHVPVGVSDLAITQERWLLRPRAFEHVGVIDMDCDKVYLNDGQNYTRLDFDNRGSYFEPGIRDQHFELNRLRGFTRKHGNTDWFFNKKEWENNYKQCHGRLSLNRTARDVTVISKHVDKSINVSFTIKLND